MKKIFVTGIMLIAMVAFATAQGFQNQTPEERAKAQVERLEKLLSLTADQKVKAEAIELEIAKERSAQMQKNQGNREAMMTAFQEINKKRDEKYKVVLTADQFKKYLDDNEQRRREMQDRQRNR